jgi:hypothetical protein
LFRPGPAAAAAERAAMIRMPIPTEQWPVFSALLDEVMERPQSEWAAWLSRLPPEHEALKPWLAKVL